MDKFGIEQGLAEDIYDAAHAFGVRLNGRSVLAMGDFAGVSFHATKVFNTFEGGAVICRSAESKRSIDLLRKFGIVDETHVELTGLNAKFFKTSEQMQGTR